MNLWREQYPTKCRFSSTAQTQTSRPASFNRSAKKNLVEDARWALNQGSQQADPSILPVAPPGMRFTRIARWALVLKCSIS